MRPGVPAFTAPQEAEALDCLLRTAQEKGAELRETASLPFPQSALGSPAAPARQCPAGHRRMGLARRSAPLAQYARNRRQRAGFRALPRTVPAHPSLQRPAALILDGAHNPHGLRASKRQSEMRTSSPPPSSSPALRTRIFPTCCRLSARIAGDAPLFVPTIQDNERAMNGEELAKLLAEGRGPAITQPTQRLEPRPERNGLLRSRRRCGQAPRPFVRLLVFARRVL